MAFKRSVRGSVRTIMVNHRYNTNKTVQYVFVIFVFMLMCIRMRYGISFEDESWYVAESYAVSKLWLLPFVNNVSQSPCFSFPLSLFFTVRSLFIKNTEGIFLFSRIVYLVVGGSINSITVYIYNKYTRIRVPIIVIALMLVSENSYSLFAINYNTIGLIYTPLVFATCLAEFDEIRSRDILWGMLTGLIASRMVLGSPQTVVVLFSVVVLCLKYRKLKRIIGIFIGGGITCVLILIWSCYWGGLNGIVNWSGLFFKQGYFDIVSCTSKEVTVHALLLLILPMASYAIIVYFVNKYLIKHKKDAELAMVIIVFLMLISATYYFLKQAAEIGFNSFAKNIWFFPLIILYMDKNRILQDIFCGFITLTYFIVYIFSTLTNIWGFESQREYWLWGPVMVSIIMIYNKPIYEDSAKQTLSIISIILCMILCTMKLHNNYAYVYRDKSIPELKVCISEGIWKGIYTSRERAVDVVELENCIRENTSPEESVLFLDWVSFGYIMSNARMCAPSTLDITYSYNVNNPNVYYGYFNLVGQIPSKIIYIDYGRDEQLSIEKEGWAFNEFIRFYVIQEEYYNERIRVKIYILSDESGACEFIG